MTVCTKNKRGPSLLRIQFALRPTLVLRSSALELSDPQSLGSSD